jgi:hypothetical protein
VAPTVHAMRVQEAPFMPSKVQQKVARVRRLVRNIIVEHGFGFGGSGKNLNVSPELTEVIGQKAARGQQTKAIARKLEERIGRTRADKLAGDVDEHFGLLMAVYDDAGYSVGVCAGVEMRREFLKVGPDPGKARKGVY